MLCRRRLQALFDGLGGLFVAGLFQQGEHVLLVGLYTGLVERIHTQDVGADTAGKLEEIEQAANIEGVHLLEVHVHLGHAAVNVSQHGSQFGHVVAVLHVLTGQVVQLVQVLGIRLNNHAALGILYVENAQRSVVIESDNQNLDQLNFLAGKHVEYCNHMAELGTQLAHIDGGVPQMAVNMEKVDAFNLGGLLYFFEFACGISAYILGVNPFNQPGVEAYKKNMFALLEKPGYEKETAAIRKRIK